LSVLRPGCPAAGKSIQNFDIRFERDALDQVEEIRLGRLGIRLVHQRQESGFHHVGAETAAFQPRRDGDQNVQIALLQFFNVLRRGGVGDDDLPGQVVGHVLAHLQKVTGDDVRLLVVFRPFGLRRLVLLRAKRVQPRERHQRDDGEEQRRQQARLAERFHRKRQTERKHEVAESDVETGFDHGLAHPVAFHDAGLQGGHALERFAFFLVQMFFERHESPFFEQAFHPAAVPHFADLDRLAELLRFSEIIAMIGDLQIKPRAAHAEGVHFAVHFTIELDGFVHVAIGALARDLELLSQKNVVRRMVA
jgi:hypothetical protein